MGANAIAGRVLRIEGHPIVADGLIISCKIAGEGQMQGWGGIIGIQGEGHRLGGDDAVAAVCALVAPEPDHSNWPPC